ncbi:MAG TPA: hypothetical protein VGH01_10555 [Jatrophihabitantaceae bacterium]
MSTSKVTLPDGSRSVQSPFVWRVFVFLSLIAVGLSISLGTSGHTLYAVAWGFIASGWFGVAMYLWRAHLRYEDALLAARRPARPARARR